jgi:Zn-dependent protease
MFIQSLQSNPRFFFAVVITVVVSITIHELAHGVVAVWRGDRTPIDEGHMTLNPAVHMGPFSIIALLVAGIAWGAMPINPSRIRGRFGEALVAAAGPGSGSPLVSVELRHLGGALARPAAAHGPLPTLDGEFVVFAVGVPLGPGALEAIRAQFGRLRDALEPWNGGRAFLNFAEQELDPGRAFDADAYARLQAAKRAYDPADLLRANHRIRVG